MPSLTVDGNPKVPWVQPVPLAPTERNPENELARQVAQRLQLLARVGLQMPIMLQLMVAPDESLGHGLPEPQACVQTWIPSAMNRWQFCEPHCAAPVHVS